MKKLLAMALCLVAVSGYAQKGKEKIAADFYGVDYSCVDVKGADEEPGAFIKAFEAINRLFLSEPKKYDVAGFTGIDILSTGVEQANESLGALAAEQFTPRSAATDWQTQLSQIVARYDNGSGNKGLVLVATTLDKGNGLGYYTAVLFDPATHEIITQMDMVGKPGGFGLRNYWAGSVYNALKKQGKYLTTEELQKKRDYMEAVKKASDLRRKMETAETRLASLMGFHPSTEFKLVGSEYGNFELPVLKNELAQLEWLALTNRPEMRAHDLSANVEDLKIVVKGFKEPELNKYKNDPNYYNRLWSKQAQQVSMTVMEDVRNPKISELNDLRRQRMTNLIISQVYVAWARYTSAVEDYQINMEIADTSENIAEDITIKDGSGNSKSILESARAVDDEVQAFLAYAEVQDALGNLYATIGLDAIPYYMLNDKPSKIAVALHKTLEKWREGEFIPDNRPYLLDVPAKRPPVNMSSLIPDYEVETGQRIKIDVPSAVFDKMELVGKITTKAGLIDDSPLPKWLNYDEKNHRFEGIAMPSNVGQYNIKLYVTDENGNVGYLTFKLKIKEVFVPSMRVDGLTDGRKATVLKRCLSSVCKDTYVDDEAVGEEVEVRAPARF